MGQVGGDVFQGSSKLLAGPLGVVRIGFNGYHLGKTTAEATLKPDQDVKDIMYQQDGTKAADHVRTGMEYILAVTFGEIKTGLLKTLLSGFSSVAASALTDSATLGRSLYQSMRTLEAKALRVVAVDANGDPSDLPEDTLCFYEAIPIITGNLINWGADVQRAFAMEFRIKFHEFAVGESVAKFGAFGYYGDPADEDLPAVVWPDVEAPIALSAAVTAATTATITFDQIIAEVDDGTTEDKVMASVDGVFIAPTASVAAGAVLTLTFPAASFAAGDVVRLYVSASVVEDTATTPNENEKFDILAVNGLV